MPHPIVKYILVQQDCLGIIGKWVSRIYEYDLEIMLTQLVKGQGLARMLREGNEKALNLERKDGPKITLVFIEGSK